MLLQDIAIFMSGVNFELPSKNILAPLSDSPFIYSVRKTDCFICRLIKYSKPGRELGAGGIIRGDGRRECAKQVFYWLFWAVSLAKIYHSVPLYRKRYLVIASSFWDITVFTKDKGFVDTLYYLVVARLTLAVMKSASKGEKTQCENNGDTCGHHNELYNRSKSDH